MKPQQKTASDASRPRSCVRWTDPLLIALAASLSYAVLRGTALADIDIALLVSLAVMCVMSAVDIYHAPWRKMPRPRTPPATTARNAGIKMVGILFCLALTVSGWAVMRGDGATINEHFFKALFALLPVVPVVIAIWVFYTEWRLGPEKDGAWHMGRAVLGKWRETDLSAIRNFMMGWVVRLIFLPLNFSALTELIGHFRGREAEIFTGPAVQAEFYIRTMILALMVAAIVPGYLFSARLLDTHIRKVDFTVTGWLVTMTCYPPLVYWVFTMGLNFYPDAQHVDWAAPWARELAGFPVLALVAGMLVLALECMHYWGEASFGLRASNLSNRGIITNGLFRYFKHPVYLSKCLVWLLWMPFLAGDTIWACLYLTLMWAGACMIYFGRAWVEERLLSDDPDYIAYALWMDDHAALSFLSKRIPPMRFEWRLRCWQNERAARS